MSTFDLNLLVSLDALLEKRNVTAAAAVVGVSQPAMSGMLNRLRAQLHDPLLVRVGGFYELTPRARELAEQVRQTLLRIESLVAVRNRPNLSVASGNLRIMASEFSLLMVLPHVFRRAQEAAPRLTFEVIPIDDPIGRVGHGDVDLCITGNTIDDVEGGAANAVRTRWLMDDEFLGLVDAGHPLGDAVTIEEFLSYPHVVTQFPGIARTVEDNGIAGLSKIYPPVIKVPSFIGIAPIVLGTEMIGVVPSRLVPLLSDTWKLKTFRLPETFARSSLRALWHGRFDRDPVHQWLRSATFDVCASLSRKVDPGER